MACSLYRSQWVLVKGGSDKMEIDTAIITHFFGAYVMGWGSGFLILFVKQLMEKV